jgi:hypothetical protein
MGIKQKATGGPQTGQLRAAAGTSGKNATRSFASVDPVQKKDDAIQRIGDLEEDKAASLKADPAQMAGGLEEELK